MFLRFLVLIFLSSTHFLLAQQVYDVDQSIPVQVNDKQLSSPWAGGLNSAQINTLDLDQDGKDDLAVYDRTANKIFTYLNVGGHYVYTPDYESYFPSDMNEWVLLRDFNCDGKKDLFTGQPEGISVYVNITPNGSPPQWRPFNGDNPLLTVGYNSNINLQVNQTDIPAIDDVDEDGDLDVIVARFVGFGSLEFHKNMSVEKTGKCDSMQLVRITTEWGNFEECNCGWFAFDGTGCTVPPNGRVMHDVGKSLLTLDLNNDGLHDLIFSEQTCTSLYLLPNTGIRDSADMDTFNIYPPTNPTTLLFPAAFFEDVDFDGVKDLTISTNISARVASAMDLSNSVLFYKNTNSNSLPQFTFQKTNLLQEQMIDVGSYASPAYADYDNDGDLDLFISYWTNADTLASIYQYQNIGTASQPSFKLMTNDYLNFLSKGLYNIKIQFVDVNNDGKKDLAFTASSLKTFTTQLYVLYNTSSSAFNFSGQTPQPLGFVINDIENVYLYDINRDGLLDILYGKADGSLQYWSNGGSATNPNYGLLNASYLGVNSSIVRYCVSPTIADTNNDGKPDLLLANHGSIIVFPDFSSGSKVSDTLFVNNALKNSFESRNLSSYMILTTADLYNDKQPLIVAGLITGGVLVLKTDIANSNQQENAIQLWPNPIEQGGQINIKASQNSSVQFYSVLGQQLSEPIVIVKDEPIAIEQTFSAGFYLARVSWAGGSKTIKFIVK